MKTIKTTKILATLIFTISFVWSFAQDTRTCTVIEVSDGIYNDKVWLFSVPNTTKGFDNGWDGYKFLSNTPAPQIYVKSTDGNFQVSTTSNIHEEEINFIPGNSENYTLTFTHTDLNVTYKALYIHDRINGKTTDIFAQGCTYTFSAKTGDRKDRFVILTSSNTDDQKKEPDNRSIKENKAKSVKVFGNEGRLSINNPNKTNALIRIFNAQNGTFIKEKTINPENKICFESNLDIGAYVVAVSVENDVYSSTILLK